MFQLNYYKIYIVFMWEGVKNSNQKLTKTYLYISQFVLKQFSKTMLSIRRYFLLKK